MTKDIEIISRKEAKERGLKRYFTGKPCKHGHIASMRTPTGACLGCEKEHIHKESKAERSREYYKQNKSKILERMRLRAQANRSTH